MHRSNRIDRSLERQLVGLTNHVDASDAPREMIFS
jgi:hypothetical protein